MGAMSLPGAVPQRLSDGERDAAISALRAHHDLGRLDRDEFAERMQSALAARTASDLSPLFSDLPAPHPLFLTAAQPTWNTYPGATGSGSAGSTATATFEPGSPSYPYPTPNASYPNPTVSGEVLPYRGQAPANRSMTQTQTTRWVGTLSALIWPVAIAAMILGGTGIWPIIAAIVISGLLSAYRRNQRTPPPY